MTPSKIRKEVLRTIGKYLSLDRHAIFLFGSRAAQRGWWYSDFDVGIWGPRPIRLNTMAKIGFELEKLPVEIDVVDFAVKNQRFRRLALRRIVPWNRPKNTSIGYWTSS